jgi:hypothetical protein
MTGVIPRVIVRGARLSDIAMVPDVLQQFDGEKIGILHGTAYWNRNDPSRNIYVYRTKSAVVVAFSYSEQVAA